MFAKSPRTPRPSVRLGSAILVFLALSGPALAHGGRFRVPPQGGGPGGVTPGNSRAGVTPRGAPGGRTPRGDTLRQWETWWGYNKDEFLPEPAWRLKAGALDDYERSSGLSREALRDAVVPVLIDLIRLDRDPDVRDSATLALGRVGDVREFEFLASLVQDRLRGVRESAIVALGLLREPRATSLLVDLAGQTDRTARERGLAVVALGFAGDDEAERALLDGLGRPGVDPLSSRKRSPDFETLRAVGVSLLHRSDLRVPARPTSHDPVTGHLLRAIREARVDENAFLPVALASLAKTRDGNALRTVLTALDHRRSDVRAGAAIALGRVADSLPEPVARQLARSFGTESDIFVRRLLLLSLGRVGGSEVRSIIQGPLSDRDTQERSFATLAAALAGYDDLGPRLVTELAEARDVSGRSARMIALALLAPEGAVPAIREVLDGDKNPTVQAFGIEALTILRDLDSMPRFLTALESRDPSVVAAAAQALGVLGGEEHRRPLLECLKRPAWTAETRGSLGWALGNLRSPEVLKDLLAFVQDRNHSDPARAYAAGALGVLGDKNPGKISPFSRVSIDAPYGEDVEVLEELRWWF